MSGYEEDAHAHHGHPGAPLAFLVLALFAGIFARTLLPKKLPYTVWLLGLGVVAGVVWDHEDAKTAHLGKVERMVRSWDVVDPHLILYGFLPALAGAGQARERPNSVFRSFRRMFGAPSKRGCVLWNARARHTHVEATSHRPRPAQVLIFESAFNTDFHTLFNELGQILVLAVPGVALGTAATACCARAIYLDGAGDPRLPWPACALLGSGPNSNRQPDFNLIVRDSFDATSSALRRALDESNRFVQKSAETTSIQPS